MLEKIIAILRDCNGQQLKVIYQFIIGLIK